MSSAGWMWLFYLYTVLNVVLAVLDLTFGSGINNLNTLAQFDVLSIRELNFLAFSANLPYPNPSFLLAIIGILTFDYSFFTGDMNIVRMVVLIPLSITVGLMFLVQVVPPMAGVVDTVRNFFRL